MINYDKQKIKEQLTQEDCFDLLTEFNANPHYSNGAIVCDTICHNLPGQGSKKLYIYHNDGKSLCHCYTNGCDETSFDIFQLVQKVAKLQWNEEYDLNTAVRYVAKRFGLNGEIEENNIKRNEDYKIFQKYEDNKQISLDVQDDIILKEYDTTILERLNYSVFNRLWYNDGISPEVMEKARIGFFPGNSQITIPHYDINNRFIGLRGRTLIKEDAEMYGKYRPMIINGQQYNHPLGFNLYGLNWNKNNIQKARTAIIFESEKASLQ